MNQREHLHLHLFAMYHAHVDEDDKRTIQGAFQPTYRILLSTIACGGHTAPLSTMDLLVIFKVISRRVVTGQ